MQVEAGVTEVTIEHESAEEGATSEVTVVRTDGGLQADTEDADPGAGGHQARLSSNGDTVALVKVTSADGLRQDGYGVILQQQAGGMGDNQDNAIVKLDARQSGKVGLSGRVAGNSGRQSRSSVVRPSLVSVAISYGDQTLDASLSDYYYKLRRYYTATVPHESAEITLTATEANGGLVWYSPDDSNTNEDGHQVNLRSSRPGAGPAETVFFIILPYGSNGRTFFDYHMVKVFRSPPTRNDATLVSLEVEGRTLVPSYVYDLLEYTASASHDTAAATVKAAANQPGGSLDYNPADADDNAEDYQGTLAVGDNLVTITVTAPDGTTTLDYTVTINRPSPPSTDATLKSLAVTGATLSPGLPVRHQELLRHGQVPRLPSRPGTGDHRRRRNCPVRPARRQPRRGGTADPGGCGFQHGVHHHDRRGRHHHRYLHSHRNP